MFYNWVTFVTYCYCQYRRYILLIFMYAYILVIKNRWLWWYCFLLSCLLLLLLVTTWLRWWAHWRLVVLLVFFFLLLLFYFFCLFLTIITLSNLSNSNVIDKICEEYASLVYHHFGQLYMSQVTTVKNRILFARPVKNKVLQSTFDHS